MKNHLDGREIYQLPPAPNYWKNQAQAGLPAYLSGMLKQWLPPPARVLEIGCEAGRATLPLRQLGYQMHGLDVVLAPLLFGQGQANQSHQSINWLQSEAQHLPFLSQIFDGVLLTRQILSLFHGRNQRLQVLAQAHRVLKKRGLLFLSIQNGAFDPTFWHLCHYLYCRIFVYDFPEFSGKKMKEFFTRLGQIVQCKKYFRNNKQIQETKDIFVTTYVSEKIRSEVPFHIYHLKELLGDLQETGFQRIDCRDFLEFEKKTKIPKILEKGAPYLILAAKKKISPAGK